MGRIYHCRLKRLERGNLDSNFNFDVSVKHTPEDERAELRKANPGQEFIFIDPGPEGAAALSPGMPSTPRGADEMR